MHHAAQLPWAGSGATHGKMSLATAIGTVLTPTGMFRGPFSGESESVGLTTQSQWTPQRPRGTASLLGVSYLMQTSEDCSFPGFMLGCKKLYHLKHKVDSTADSFLFSPSYRLTKSESSDGLFSQSSCSSHYRQAGTSKKPQAERSGSMLPVSSREASKVTAKTSSGQKSVQASKPSKQMKESRSQKHTRVKTSHFPSSVWKEISAWESLKPHA